MNHHNVISGERKMESEKWNIIAKQLAKEELSGEEMEIFESLKTDKEMNKIIDQSAAVFDKTDLYFSHKNFDTNKAWDKVNSQLTPARKKATLTWVLRVAAIMLVLVTTGVALWQFGSKKNGFSEFTTSDNDFSRPEIVLPDGTKVTLNHSSKISYPTEFAGTTREVTLSGEAFFDVTPNAQKPFIIKTNSASIKVLGTSFNVYAYTNNPLVEVVVKTGKVELLENSVASETLIGKVLLLPGEKGVFDKLNKKMSKEVTSNNNTLSWITHEIEFEETTLEEAINTLNRTFNLQVDVDNNVDKNLHISATFNHQKPEYIMDVVALTLNLKLEKTGNNRYIIKNNN
jgi:ferric-dicitrate binding protein FerR (iron transport regulator)